jgi:hypothetical protein
MGYRVFWYALTSHGVHTSHPNAYKIRATIISGGGGGMGSKPDMSFLDSSAYAMYGQKGGAACWDTLPEQPVHLAGSLVTWPGHGLVADQPVFWTPNPNWLLYVYGPSVTADTFQLSIYPYAAPGVTTPYQPYDFGYSGDFLLNVYRHAVLGGNGGGGIGDQAIPGSAIGIYSGDGYSPPRSRYQYGGCGSNALGAGGRGGALFGSGAGAEQIGGSDGNPGMNLQGEGGSGAGFVRLDGSYPVDQFGPGGGAGGTMGIIESELKESYHFHAGPAGAGGAPGPGGFRGGAGSMPLVQVEEWFPD